MKAVFVDTMGWFSLLNRRDAWHERARQILHALRESRVPLITTDYVIDETATLLKVRRADPSIHTLFDMLDTSRACTLTRIDTDRFQAARDFFIQHLDHGYSFTDVTSFVVMKELLLREAFTHDDHFTEAGFERLLR